MDSVCTFCLSREKASVTLNTNYWAAFQGIFDTEFDQIVHELDISSILRLCWDCHDQLQKILMFIQKAKASISTLKLGTFGSLTNQMTVPIKSNLSTTPIGIINLITEDTKLDEETVSLEEYHDFDNSVEIKMFAAGDVTKDNVVEDTITPNQSVGKRKFRCGVCGLLFPTWRRRRVHRDKEHDTKAEMKCEKCGKVFHTPLSFREHVKRHSNPEVECKLCNKKYRNNTIYKTHFKMVHEKDGSNKYKCEECDVTFTSIYSLQSHMRTTKRHADPSNYKHICYVCGVGFAWEREMTAHVDYSHRGQTRHVCKHCGKMLKNASSLTKHIQFVHEGARIEKNKPCHICGKKFSTATLKQHVNIHTGARPHRCEVCGDTFRQSAALYNHKRLVHLGYKRISKKIVKCNENT